MLSGFILLQPLVKFKSHLYFEEKDYVTETEKNLKPVSGSKVRLILALKGANGFGSVVIA